MPKPENVTTTDRRPPAPGFEDATAPQPIDPTTGQHCAYWVLNEAERNKGFVRPVRDRYKHVGTTDGLKPGCGTVTTMGRALAETYARDPQFYNATFCCGCGTHLPIGEYGGFVWVEHGRITSERVGT